jgi:hypothetical protein
MSFLLLQDGGRCGLQAGGNLLLQHVPASLNATDPTQGGYTIAEYAGAAMPPKRRVTDAAVLFQAYSYGVAQPEVVAAAGIERTARARTRSFVEPFTDHRMEPVIARHRAKLTATARIVAPPDDALIALLTNL